MEKTPTPTTHLARSAERAREEKKAEADGHGTRPAQGGEDGRA